MLLEDLQIILKVAEFRSITAAAANLDMRTATASAAVKRVENALGLELFIRTTRHLRLSSAGERYIPQCEQALLMLDQAKQNMKDGLDIVDGELRIALSSDLGRNFVQPWLDEFMDAYPQLSVRANISDSNVDFYRDAVDMALRYGSPTDANVYGFKICDVPRVLCATKAYLAQHGTPSVPNDLTRHNALLYQLHDVIQDVWEFSADGVKHKVKLTGNRASNDGDMVRRWCTAGHGLAVKSSLDMSQDLLSGKVESVMPAFKVTPTELWLVCPSRQSITPAVRLLRDAFREKTAAILEQLADKGVI
ncbi:LysR family transcriptional regulator [Photobacterium sanguinicancri]|uniref:LysR family transcriptional regulator n=1 Tax=Photobacterium sanguinicancri TaxID=875932 RepID=A0AAW7XZL8_9GAMM|nr:LysR family transcriptional regulator [Photobacterium sanguinicancri]MDO6541748.1 LysR family transcriptional regulator [Photobacterium sanguinicancri]